MANLSIENLNRRFDLMDPLGGQSQRTQRQSRMNSASEEGGEGLKPGVGFIDMLAKTLDRVNQDQIEADHSIKNLVAGRSKNIHETMLTVERADLSLKLMMQVRNKLLDAYREIMRMQV